MQWLNRLVCGLLGGHTYKFANEHMIHMGMGKMRIYRCTTCKKRKVEFI